MWIQIRVVSKRSLCSTWKAHVSQQPLCSEGCWRVSSTSLFTVSRSAGSLWGPGATAGPVACPTLSGSPSSASPDPVPGVCVTLPDYPWEDHQIHWQGTCTTRLDAVRSRSDSSYVCGFQMVLRGSSCSCIPSSTPFCIKLFFPTALLADLQELQASTRYRDERFCKQSMESLIPYHTEWVCFPNTHMRNVSYLNTSPSHFYSSRIPLRPTNKWYLMKYHKIKI